MKSEPAKADKVNLFLPRQYLTLESQQAHPLKANQNNVADSFKTSHFPPCGQTQTHPLLLLNSQHNNKNPSPSDLPYSNWWQEGNLNLCNPLQNNSNNLVTALIAPIQLETLPVSDVSLEQHKLAHLHNQRLKKMHLQSPKGLEL